MSFTLIPLAITGSLSEAFGMMTGKKILRWHKANVEDWISYSFLAIVLVSVPLVLFFWKIVPEAWGAFGLLMLGIIVFVSIIANLFNSYSMKKENLSELEPMKLFQPLFVILFALLIYPVERESSIWIITLAIIASLALIISHVEKEHLKINKYMIFMLLASILFGLELALSKMILPFYNPITFYFVRSLLIFLLTLPFFAKNLGKITKSTAKLYFLSGAAWVLFRGLVYYGYIEFGVVFTTLIFMLTPIFLYTFSKIFLKEKLSVKNIIASIVIVGCVAGAIYIGN
jgi:drug/metabolite transporter (DMT)-like permease